MSARLERLKTMVVEAEAAGIMNIRTMKIAYMFALVPQVKRDRYPFKDVLDLCPTIKKEAEDIEKDPKTPINRTGNDQKDLLLARLWLQNLKSDKDEVIVECAEGIDDHCH